MSIALDTQLYLQRRSEGRNSPWLVLVKSHSAPPNGEVILNVSQPINI